MVQSLIEYPNGGKIEIYKMVNTATSDFKKIFVCCEYFAKQGKCAIITPRFGETVGNPDYEIIYASLKGTPYWGKCPDFNVNGKWYEHEGFDENKDLTSPKKRADTFSLMLKRGIKQSNRIIIDECNVGRYYAKRTIYNRIRFEHQNIAEVYIRTNTGLEVLYKKED